MTAGDFPTETSTKGNEMPLNIQKLLLMTLTFLAMAAMSFGQRTDATFSGAVTDASGAVLPGAEIQLINEGTAAVLQQLRAPHRM